MQIDNETLPSLAVFDSFRAKFEEHAREITRPALLTPILSMGRLKDAHYAWQQDVTRVEQREKHLVDGMDHFKQCAHLAYWLRRQTPIVDYYDWSVIQDDPQLYPDEIQRREFLARYGIEFIAFDFGYRISLYYELDRLDAPRAAPPVLSIGYLTDVCHMLKFKHVSPHALYLIYRSLFM